MASSYPSRLWAQLTKCVYIITCGFCGTPSSALEDAALAEPLLRNAQTHPAASSEAPSTAVLTASQQQQPALPARISTPVNKTPPEPAAAAIRGHESSFGNNEASGTYADPVSAQQTQSPRHASDDLSNLAVPDGQKSRDIPEASGVEVPDSALHPQQVLPFPKLDSSQPAQAHGPKCQAPSAMPRQPASSEHGHDERATDRQPASQASHGSAAEVPVVEQNSKASIDQAEAAADKKFSAASSVAAAVASPDSESCNQRGSTPVSQIGAASQDLQGNLGAAAPENLLSDSAAKAVQSKAQVKPSAQEFSVPEGAATKQSPVQSSPEKALAADELLGAKGDAAKQSEGKLAPEGKRSAATKAAAKHSLVEPSADKASVADKQSLAKGPSAKEHLAADERQVAPGAAAKHSKGQTPSAADSDQAAVSSSSQSLVQSTSKLKHREQSTADDAGGLAANQSPSATAAPTGTASKPQHSVQRSVAKVESAAGGKSQKPEIKSKTQPERADKGTVDAEKPQPETRALGAAIHSAMDMPGGASSQEAARGDDPVDEESLDAPKGPPKDVDANTASLSSQQDATDASTRSEPQEELAHTKDVHGPLSAQHSAGDNNGTAANGDSKGVDNSLGMSEESGTANTAAKEASRKSNGKSHRGGHDSSPDQEGGRSDMGTHAVITHEGPAGSGPNVAGQPEFDTAKTAGSESEEGNAGNGHHAAQMAETGTAQKGTAASDAGAGKKKHIKGKKKKKGK